MSYVMHVDVIMAAERGITQNEWLDSKHSFSFGSYHNLKRLNFGTLRVFNDDIVQPGKGFGTHAHENMEIVTIVLEGALEHKDSQGNHGILKPGDVQRMTAGTGIEHSEFNASQEKPLRFLQIWVYPKERNLQPGYEQKTIPLQKNSLQKIVAETPSETTLSIHQDATFYLGQFDSQQTIVHTTKSRKHCDYIFVIDGELALGDHLLKSGDSAEVTESDRLEMQTLESTKVLLIEVNVNTL
ncbi:MAG: Quercetin 2,3-dioxygenase [Chlamydiae bacterium]|nr:Quercetin 2,3-dioxygenase [Chlamydiota bacterium]